MNRRIFLAVLVWCSMTSGAQAQEFKIFDRRVQVHGFASQGLVATDDNNWLTMKTSQGSGAMTDMGLNMSMQITDRFRVGAQVYDRNLGQLGQWHPSLDWALADYKFKPWFGIRGGKVKTVMGLYNDTQDLDFLHTFALLPQSVYPTDLRDATIAHTGGDVFGQIPFHHSLGDLSYTAYVGRRSDSIYSGYVYLLSAWQAHIRSYTALQYGADLRWNTPVKGLLIGVSRMNEQLEGNGSFVNLVNPSAGLVPFHSTTKSDWTNQFYGQFAKGKLRLDAEYRRSMRDADYAVTSGVENDMRGWYIAGAYRVTKRLQVGSYYSRYNVTALIRGPLRLVFPDQTDPSLPQDHIYDKVVSARVDLNRFWNVKLEGHFMDGFGLTAYPDGFYPQVNPTGFKPNTNALVLKTSFNF